MRNFLVAFFMLQFIKTESEPLAQPLLTGFWNNSKVRILLIEYMLSFFAYLAVLVLDLLRKKFFFYPSQQKVEITIEQKNTEKKDQFPQIDEDAFEPREQQIDNEQQPQFDPQDDQKVYIEGKSIHEFCYDILIIHGLCLGFVVTGGYHSLGLVLVGWIHMASFLGFLAVNHLQKFQRFFKHWMILFAVLNFAILVISLLHVKQFNNKQFEWTGKNLLKIMQVKSLKNRIVMEDFREILKYQILAKIFALNNKMIFRIEVQKIMCKQQDSLIWKKKQKYSKTRIKDQKMKITS